MWNWFHQLLTPKNCYFAAESVAPWFLSITLIVAMYGLFAGLWSAPPDYQQGNVYRIIYIHVPAAILSMSIYMAMACSAFVFLIWKIKVADVIATVCAPIGACFTALTLITGSIWGKPTWGTWWIWDARLTSELILLFIYFGVIALRSSIPDRQLAASITNIFTIIGAVNIPIIHYSVVWWNTLHQGATILQFKNPNIAPSMLHPLLAMIASFFCYFLWLLTLRVRHELLLREKEMQWVKNLISGT